MSGILGTTFTGAHWRDVTDRSAAVARAREARDTLAHRGADFAGDWYDDRLYLGHTEQAQLDSNVVGRLPLAAGDGSVTVSLDGHLANAQDLRAELGKSHAFHGNGGSEIVLQAYLRWGLDGMLQRLRGSFALAIYDRAKGQLSLVRDALGTKPLYYLHDEASGSIMFASELKGIEALATKSLLTVDQTAVYDYLTYRYIPAPKTLYTQVRKLSAGQCLGIDLTNSHASIQSYWQLPEVDSAAYSNSEEFVERGRELLEKAVDSRTSGLAAVGGMCQRDSGFADWLSAQKPSVRPLTLTSDVMQPAQETSARRAAMLGGGLREWFDEPFADTSFLKREDLLDQLNGSSICAITDIGAEVLFGTASRYARAGRQNTGTVGWIKSKLGSNKADASTTVVDAFHDYAGLLGGLPGTAKSEQKAAWEIPADYNDYWYYQQYYRADLPRTLRFQQLDLQTLMPEHELMQLDRQAQRHGIEARAPLLDQDLVSWLLCAPAQWRGPQFDVQTALFGSTVPSQPVLARIKKSVQGVLPVGRGGSGETALGPLELLEQRFPELGL